MSSLKSSGEGLPGFENDASADSNPYAYPYFHCNGTSPLVFDLVVQFARHWNEITDENAATLMELQMLVRRIRAQCQANPMETAWRDSCGDTALHRLCQVARYPSFSNIKSIVVFATLLVDVAEALIEAHPGSATKARNNWKETPLHQFCSHCGFPNNKVKDSNEATETSNIDNPMLDLLKLLSKDNACSMRNCWGSFPLHDACGLPGWEVSRKPIWKPSIDGSVLSWMKRQHESMVQYIISQHVKAVRLRVEGGETPLCRAFASLKCSVGVLKMLLALHEANDATLMTSFSALWKHYQDFPQFGTITFSTLHHFANYEPQAQLHHLGVLWKATILALGKLVSNPQLLVHSAAATKDCPLYVVELLIRLYPEHLLVTDENGCTPLLIAVGNRRDSDIVNAVLRGNPAASSIHNSDGRLPLCVAVATGTYSYQDTLGPLFSAEPKAVTTRDPVTSLFPFSLAATVESVATTATTSHASQRNEEGHQLSNIFELLRRDPSILTR